MVTRNIPGYWRLSTICFLMLTGCAHQVQKPAAPSRPAVAIKPLAMPVRLKLVGQKGRREVSTNCSESITKTYVGSELRFKKIEAVDFKVQTVTTDVLKNGNLKQTIDILSKEGSFDLHDLAYPEMGETLDIQLTPLAKVVHAGRYKKDSIFFLPPIPLPSKPVSVGDSWHEDNAWVSEAGGLPLTSSMDVIFARTLPCGEHMCADVKVSGEVHMPEKLERKNGFAHRLSGRFLFEPESGLLVWSEFESREQLQTEGARVEVHSVLRSALDEPPGYRTVDREAPSCPLGTMEE